jgi:hypothetical protein
MASLPFTYFSLALSASSVSFLFTFHTGPLHRINVGLNQDTRHSKPHFGHFACFAPVGAVILAMQFMHLNLPEDLPAAVLSAVVFLSSNGFPPSLELCQLLFNKLRPVSVAGHICDQPDPAKPVCLHPSGARTSAPS